MKNFKKIVAILILFSLTFSSINIVKAEWEEETNNATNARVIPTVSNDPRVTIRTEQKKEIEVEVDTWPHKHKLWTWSLSLFHKPAWMYLLDNKMACDEKWATYFIVNAKWEKIKKISINCSVVFKDEEKTKEVIEDVFEDVEGNGESLESDEDITIENNNEESESDDEVDIFIEDLLWKNSSNKLKTVKLNTKIYTIASKKMSSSIKEYSLNKTKILIWDYTEIKGLKNRDYYNGLVVRIFTQFAEKVGINKFQNEFAKNLSTISFSLSSYQDENLDMETREFFRKKFVNDLRKLQISYSKIQKKENTIKNFFLNKG